MVDHRDGIVHDRLIPNATTPFYYEQWALDRSHPRLQSLVSEIFTTFLSSYAATLFLTMLFSHWMREPSTATHEPWLTFDRGIPSIVVKISMVIVFYGACIGAWWVQRS